MPKFYCIHCGQHIDASVRMAGRQSLCPTCGGKIVVPEIPKPPPLPPAATPTTPPPAKTTIFVGVAMITSWILPIIGIFIIDSTALKIMFAIFLAINFFVGGSASGAQRMAHEGSLKVDHWMRWEAGNVIVKAIIAVFCIATFFLFDGAKPIKGIYTESELQRVYIREKQEYEAKSRSCTQTIIATALRKDSASKKTWKKAVEKRKALKKKWEGRERDFQATRESLR